MANYDELNGNMRALYDAAKKELADMEKKRAELENIVSVLSPLYGSSKKTYSVEDLKAVEAPRVSRRGKKAAKAVESTKGDKKPRIKEAVIRSLVMQYLSDAYPNSMSAGEIFGRLEKEGMPSTTSFRTRIYGKLGAWTEDGTIERPDRGVYRIKTPVEKA